MCWIKSKNYNNLIILPLLLLSNLIWGQSLDTLYINLDSLTANESLLEVNYNISQNNCGNQIKIPIVLITLGSSTEYRIINFIGVNSYISKKDKLSNVIKPNSSKTVNWYLYEDLFSKHCSENRKMLLPRITYISMDEEAQTNLYYEKKIKINYHYID